MASDVATVSIANRVAQSLAAFEAIETVRTQEEPSDSQSTVVQTISDQLSRFKLWAGNIGAHQTGRSSLDYRLRDSSHLHTQVVRLLDDLVTSLHEVHSILSGETLPWDLDPGEVGELDQELKDLLVDEDFEFDSELGQLTKEISDVIGNLLRLSMSLRNPTPHDHFMSTEYAKVRYFEANDKAHVEAKFPRASQTLIIRLGQALSKRRQYFRYRESHHEKLARGLFDSGRSEAGAQSTVASSIPLAMRVSGAAHISGELDEDERSDTGFSQTSFATTAPDSDRLRIPPLPKKAYDGPFECPFCFMLISVSSTHQWKKHVLRDLRPYICLAEDCPGSNTEYGRRHEWMNHMLQKHWKSWVCPYQCGSDHATETNLRRHITKIHGPVTDMELDTIIVRCGRSRSLSPSSPAECPLCQDTLESVQQYQRHVGRHQVDLALFALPKIGDDDEEPDRNEDQQTISTRSSSYSEALDDIPAPSYPVSERESAISPIKRIQEDAYRKGRLDARSTEELASSATRGRFQSPTVSAQPTESIAGVREEEYEAKTDFSEAKSKLKSVLKDTLGQLEDYRIGREDSEYNESDMGAYGLKRFVQSLNLREKERPMPPARAPTIINNSVYSLPNYESEEDDTRSRTSFSLSQKQEAVRMEYELKRTQKELEELKLAAEVEQAEKRRDRTAHEEWELRLAKEELNAIREKRARDMEESYLREELELLRLKSEEVALAEKKRREEEAKEAVHKYKKEEHERAINELEYKQRLEEQLLKSGLNEKEVNAILEGKKIKEKRNVEKEDDKTPIEGESRPTYTRFARRHLSLETLRVYDIDYAIDQDPEYVIIKRWVPESEQDLLWQHTREIRDRRRVPFPDDEKKISS
ncbi:hypothetical protein F4859DRAFT_514876 [Xylaria cf. heliscus]|nr:hypothetical protein F4859DRAFT_514876 [Xylaria cf. heliscus]